MTIGHLGLTSAEADAYSLAPFLKGLSEAGFTEGRNVTIDYHFAERDVSRLPALAAEHPPQCHGNFHCNDRLGARRKGGNLNYSCRVRDRC